MCNRNHCCVPTVEVVSISQTGTVMTLFTGPFTGALGCTGKFNLCIPFAFSPAQAGDTVQISDGTTIFPVMTCTGNSLRIWQLLCSGRCGQQRKFLHARVLNDPVHVQVTDCLPMTCNSTIEPILPFTAAGGNPVAASTSAKAVRNNGVAQ